jgi:pimeloyl-ACP methyl ester carboxylesterase
MIRSSGVREACKEYKLSVRRYADPLDNNGLALSRSHHLLIFIHGFNNSEEKASHSYRAFFRLLKKVFRETRNSPDALVHFHWPSDCPLEKVSDPVGYSIALGRARDAAKDLATFLSALPSPGPSPASVRVSLIGHSMGCRVILETLILLGDEAPDVDVVFLMAAAVPIEFATTAGRLNCQAWKRQANQLVKIHSENDGILRWLFPIGQLGSRIRGKEEKERSFLPEAIGLHGNPGEFGERFETNNGHSDYWTDLASAHCFLGKVDAVLYEALSRRDQIFRPPLQSHKLPMHSRFTHWSGLSAF